jgi:hypothetical protein
MIVDQPASEFCSPTGSPELAGVSFPALQASFRMMRFDRCTVDMDMLFPFAPGKRTCRELFGIYSAAKYDAYDPELLDRLELSPDGGFDRVYAFGGTQNYWHYLVDLAANLPLLKHFAGPVPPLAVQQELPASFVSLIQPICHFLDVPPPAIVVSPERFLRLTNSFVPCVNDLKARLLFLRHFGRSIQQSAGGRGPERVFLRRGNTAQRRVLNEAELEERLIRELGFTAIDSGALSIPDQIKTMKDARIVAGGHGAALTNLIFAAEEPALVVELFVNQPQPFFRAACAQLGLSHMFIAGHAAAAAAGTRSDNTDFTVDVEEIIRRIDAATYSN